MLQGRALQGVLVERLAVVPARRASAGRPYLGRARSELARLLQSTSVTASGLPEAVVARLALGESGALSTDGTEPAIDVGQRLLAGELPVRAEDLPYLARALGVTDAGQVRSLQERLRLAPDAPALPAAPSFHRRLGERRSIHGWSRDRNLRVHYEVGIDALLQRVGLEQRARLAGDRPEDGRRVTVPDVEGLELAVSVEAGEEPRLQALRVVLWIAVIASVVALVAVRRGLVREARATAREKAFLAGVSHELRTPLASVRVLGETLAEGRGDPREYGTLIAEESERLEGLVERVLAVARIDEAPRFARVEPLALVRSAVALLAPRAERRGVHLDCRLSELPAATWDADAVRQALVNLIDNAIRHGRQGGHVAVGAVADGDAVRLSVSDDGPGIRPRDRRGLFGRFVRGASDAPGTGLGLYHVDQVARAHGGRVDLESQEGRGCTFTLLLPLIPAAAEGARAPS